MRFIELSDFFYYTAISYPLVLGKSRFYLPTLSSEASNKKPCRTKHVTEDEIHEKFLEAYNRYIGNRESLICAADKMCGVLSDTNALEQKLEQKTTLRNEKAAIYHEWISFETGERSDSFIKKCFWKPICLLMLRWRLFWEKSQKSKAVESSLSII